MYAMEFNIMLFQISQFIPDALQYPECGDVNEAVHFAKSLFNHDGVTLVFSYTGAYLPKTQKGQNLCSV